MELRRQHLLQQLTIKGIETCINGEKLLRNMTLLELETEFSRHKDRDFEIPKVGEDAYVKQNSIGRTLNKRPGIKIYP